VKLHGVWRKLLLTARQSPAALIHEERLDEARAGDRARGGVGDRAPVTAPERRVGQCAVVRPVGRDLQNALLALTTVPFCIGAVDKVSMPLVAVTVAL